MKINKINKLASKNFKIESSLFFDGIIVGIVVGIVGVLYRFLISFSEKVVHILANFVQQGFFHKIFLLVFLVILALLSGIFLRKEPHASGSGIPQVAAEMTGRINSNPLKVIIYKILGGTTASLGGLSLGREGPSIQLGAMSGKLVSKIFKKNSIREKYLITGGASAGLSVAFGAPLAGVLFSIEEIHKHISKKIIICCFSAAVVANIIGQYIFGFDAIFSFPEINNINIAIYFWVALLGIFLGIFGTFYNITMKLIFKFYSKLNLPFILRPQVAFIISFFLFLAFPIVLGSGHNLVDFLINNKFSLAFLLLLFFIKTLFSILSFTSGVAGGIFLPILIQGAILGTIFSTFFDKSYLPLFIILSMAGYLTAIVRSPITSIVLLFEMTQKLNYFLPLAICCLFAYYTANSLGTKPIYEFLLERLLSNKKEKTYTDDTEIEIITTVEQDSILINKLIKEIAWPKNILIASIERDGKDIIPKGDTKLIANDKLTIIMPQSSVTDFLTQFGN